MEAQLKHDGPGSEFLKAFLMVTSSSSFFFVLVGELPSRGAEAVGGSRGHDEAWNRIESAGAPRFEAA